ncbi:MULTISPECIES: sigma-70 family RNA polymerase sigma factor [Pseudomonas]|uniref:sigma-70 family RNA polymerase sigma factor n=1 Tax=Pseudomonas TaxID=286 RepID=UPI000C87FEA0|nr:MULTISPECIES: sigma-70 family RNA polymerase sigma factor [Pseudomonas]MBI6951285.1 sigma-70 family RNA polymerase sigma factor [Pseudomonas sp. CCOS 191]PMZ97955.1 RNA polymerase subunit sigma [Pseudomonas sp. FW305-42]PNA22513.1 RNA polymerase subunit sigma [Pseudomonas sp. MPR-R1B]PNB26069.1 RNA polymerase subunit sigma [Pseudomonas sp. DP16D-E2]PNB43648.1 RNA polymerase subunit sigma [Pseudomonas sp. FW305-17]
MLSRPAAPAYQRSSRETTGAVVEHYYRELVSFLSARLGNRQAAEDVAHDAYIRVLERTGGERIEHPRAFLYRTAMNLVVDHHRRHQVRQAEPLEVLDSDERWHSPAPTHSMQLDQRLALMQQALGELSAPCRDSFLLRKLEGLSHQQIAERLDISRSVVEKHIVNAMKHCRMRMRQWES